MSDRMDVIVIGAGVTGCAVARELSRYEADVLVLEREEDVCSGTSKANSAIVHAGFDAETGSMKARMNVRGSEMMEVLSRELDFEYRRNGSLVLCFDAADGEKLRELYERGMANGVKGLELLTGDAVRKMEPNISDTVVAALYAPTGGIVCPFNLTIALAENAADNGVRFRFNAEVTTIEKETDGYSVTVRDIVSGAEKTYQTRYIVNAAGVYADTFHNMVSETKLHITARRGEYCLLDKTAGAHVDKTVFQLPGKYGKGVLVTPTIHGNLLVGPTAVDQEDKEATNTSAAGLAEAMSKAALSVRDIPFRETITSFSGLRAHEDGDDFVIGEVADAKGFYDAAGIESPGLSSAPAIGEYLTTEIAAAAGFEKNEDFNPKRQGIARVALLPEEERAARIKENPLYGRIICRCEGISEGEIVDAIERTLGARSMDGIKRRVRQGMGRCQAGFCTPRAMEILSEHAGIPMERICKNRTGSELIRE